MIEIDIEVGMFFIVNYRFRLDLLGIIYRECRKKYLYFAIECKTLMLKLVIPIHNDYKNI